MPEQYNTAIIAKVEHEIKTILDGDNLKHALDFINHMTAIGMTLEMDYHPTFTYLGEWVCLLVYPKDGTNPSYFGICSWPGELDVMENVSFPIDENLKNFAKANVKKCFHCGGCEGSDYPGPLKKMVFGKEYDDVCCNAFHFFNSSNEEMENAKKLMELLKHIIADTKQSTKDVHRK